MGRRLLVVYVAAIALLLLAFLTSTPLLFWVGAPAYIAAGWRLFFYMRKDLHVRGRSRMWAWFIGDPFTIVAWLIWRRSHPIVQDLRAGETAGGK